jgi:CelD/BcsL family acetyltransferase involved in cellulose biosynthesis
MTGNGWRVEAVESFAAWTSLASRWNALLDSSRARSVFLTWEWLSAWAETYLGPRRRLWILTVWAGDELVGVAPWYLERGPWLPVRFVKFLGSPEGGADHLDVFTKPGAEMDVAESLAAHLRRSSEWGALWLTQMAADSLILVHLARIREEIGLRTDVTVTTHAPFLRLPRNEEELQELLTPKRRKQFRQHAQRLAEVPGFEKRYVRDGEVIDRLDEFFDLYGGRGLSLCDRPELLKEFLKRFLARTEGKGWLRMDRFTASGQLVAGHIHLWYGRTLSGYLIAIDRNFQPTISLGRLIIWGCAERAVRAGFEVYDFLRGRETFKFHFAREARALCHLISGRNGFLHAVLVLARAVKGSRHVFGRP